MATTQADIQTQLDNVNAAINDILTGGAVHRLQLGEKIIERVSLDELRRLKAQLHNELAAFQPNRVSLAGF